MSLSHEFLNYAEEGDNAEVESESFHDTATDVLGGSLTPMPTKERNRTRSLALSSSSNVSLACNPFEMTSPRCPWRLTVGKEKGFMCEWEWW